MALFQRWRDGCRLEEGEGRKVPMAKIRLFPAIFLLVQGRRRNRRGEASDKEDMNG